MLWPESWPRTPLIEWYHGSTEGSLAGVANHGSRTTIPGSVWLASPAHRLRNSVGRLWVDVREAIQDEPSAGPSMTHSLDSGRFPQARNLLQCLLRWHTRARLMVMIILERIASGTATQFRSSRNSTDSQSHENRPSGGPPLGLGPDAAPGTAGRPATRPTQRRGAWAVLF